MLTNTGPAVKLSLMPEVIKTVEMAAPIERVFDLISRVEEFTRYSRHVREIRKTGEREYLWKVEFLGIPVEWTARVVEYERPSVFAWQSTSGAHNRGRYTLTPSEGGTLVAFEMEFSVPFLPEVFTTAVLGRLAREVCAELLGNMKKALEGA